MAEAKPLDTPAEQAQSIKDLGQLLAQTYQEPEPEAAPPDISPQEPEAVPSQAESDAAKTSEPEGDAPETAQKVTVKALAEKLGMDAKDLYAVEVLDGLTLGELKDRGRELKASDEMLATAQETRATVEAELLHKNQALRLAMDESGVQVTEETLARAQHQTEQYRLLQDRIAVELMPDWSDEATRHEAEKAIDGLLDEYGYFPAEKPYMVDARLRKMFRDYARLRSEARDVARKKVTTSGKGQKPKATTKASRENVTDLIASGKLTQTQAVEALGRLLE